MTEAGTPSIYLDANIFIYFIEGEPGVSALLEPLFFGLRRRSGLAITSELTLAEVLAPRAAKAPKTGRVRPSPALRRRYLSLIAWGGVVDLRPITRQTLYETAEIRAVTGLKLPDAIHLVTATQARCRYFVSNDKGLRKLPTFMTAVAPGSATLASLVSELADR